MQGCHNNQRKSKNVKFHRFPVYDLNRKNAWIQAVNRRNPDGSLKEPLSGSLVCSEHFFGGKKEDDPCSPSFIPTIFSPDQRRTPFVSSRTRYQLNRIAIEKENKNRRKTTQEPPQIIKVEKETEWQRLEALEATDSCETDEFDPSYEPELEFVSVDSPQKQMVDKCTNTIFSDEICPFLWICEREYSYGSRSHSTMVRCPKI